MELVVDTNRIIAALIKDSYSRRIILNEKFTFYTINFGVKEVKKYKALIKKKARINNQEFDYLMRHLLSKIIILNETEISRKSIAKASKIMQHIDADDVYFIALSIELGNKPIWSDDKHFLKQKEIKIWPTKTLAKKT